MLSIVVTACSSLFLCLNTYYCLPSNCTTSVCICPLQVLDAEQVEVDKQLKILERRLRETSEDDQVGRAAHRVVSTPNLNG